MPGTLSLSPTVSVFPCPHCGQTINDSAVTCPFCAQPIDRETAATAAAETSRISQACSDASYLRIMAWSLLTFFGLLFVPFLGLAGIVGFWFLRVALPFMVIRWWIKYGKIRTTDSDFIRARRSAIVVAVVAVLAFLNMLPIGIHINR